MWPAGTAGKLPAPRDSALRKAAFSGNLSALPLHLAPSGRRVRVFVSANPEDTVAERNALREHVYPKLREFCRENYGMEFQVIDLYWGVDPEEWDSPDLQKTRMRLLEDCLKTSAGPCFVGLLGEKYGGIRIPGEVESSEFEMILDAAIEAKLETKILEECYCRDENAVPPTYYLKPKSEILKINPNMMEASCNPARQSKWQDVSEEIKVMFKTAVKILYEKGKMKHSQANRYLCSAIEDEFDFALGNQTPAFLKKCVCYIRKIANIERFVKVPEMEKYMDVLHGGGKFLRDPEALEKLVKLRDEFVPTIVASSNLRVYTSVTHCDIKYGYTQEVESHYIEGLGKQFYEDMVDIIQATVQQNFDIETDWIYDEVLQHSSLCRSYSSFYEYRCDARTIMRKYLLPKKMGHVNPLILYGGLCTGKTFLLAEVAKKAYAWLKEEMGPESDPVVIIRFVGLTERSTDLRNLLQSICEQLAVNYRCLVHSYPKKIHDLQDLLVNLLNESSFHRPLVLIFDALEQLAENDDARKLWWLPVHLPRSVRIILSTLPNKHGILQKLKSLIYDEDNYIELTARDRKMCSQFLKHQLLQVKRKVTSGQQIYVNEAFSKCTLPMFVNLTFQEVRKWRSHKDVDGSSLCVTVHDSIEQMFWSLQNSCGPKLLSRALGYITMSKSGLSEMELEDILALDNTVMLELSQSIQNLNPLRVPYIYIAKLKEGLAGYLIQRQVKNVTLLVWANRHLQLIAQKIYLHNEEDVHEMHTVIAEYFLGVWSGGRRKSLYGEDQYLNGCLDSDSRSMNDEERHMMDHVNFDRQSPDQPWVFQCNPLEPDIFFINHRKMTELLHHLTKCGKTDDILYGVIMNFSWLYTMIKIGQFDKALSDVELAYNYSQEKELKFLANTLRAIKYKVIKYPGTLSAELQQSGDKLATVTSEFSGGFVKFLLILDAAQEMVMVDSEGALSIWNTEEIAHPQLMDDFDCRRGDSDFVSLELAEDQSAILICKSLSIDLLDTSMWKVAEKFKAKRNERFVSAALSKNGDYIIASIENTSAIFIWRRDTGQCMANLQEISGNIVRLIKSNHHNMLLSLSTSGVLSVWDIDIITAMSNIDKTGKPIQRLVLPSKGEAIYTLDGSEAIHKWNFSTGFIEAVFKHESLVERCVLTSNGKLMITSDDKCSQYVWQTGSGENLFRINGQRICQLLITHNDQFVVSLCEQNASRVWRLSTGHRICNILVALQNAFITTANTFVVGMTKNKILAVSLWTGSITKKFSCDDGIAIVDIKLIPDCPDIVVFITSAETVNIYSLTEEVVSRRLQLPNSVLKTLEDFEISPNGKLGILSCGDENINILDLHSGKLRVVHASGIIWRQKLSQDGRYLVYICFRSGEDDEDNSAVSILIVMRLADGKNIGACSLYKTPTFLTLSQRHLNIIVGFDDGSIATYTVVDRVDAALKIKIATSNSRQIFNNATQLRPKCHHYSFKATADCIWRESTEVFARDSPITVVDAESSDATPTKKHNYCYDKVCSAIDCRVFTAGN
ncbi:NACHT and WD repeat domain-containing protein 2 [Crotalus adamanteus]|uniref:NACHT and WD repeat domain-containing protein 2 n=1 Tax=Crotalus adamanteus TaxID=8729 RepID=A0AAW1BCG6_CROAD